MAASISYVDIGAVQRIETGTETALTDYVDIGAVQRQETGAPPPGSPLAFGQFISVTP